MKFESWIINEIKKQWDNKFLGELQNVQTEVLQEGIELTEDDKNFTAPISLLMANIAAAMSTGTLLGSASKSNLKSVKSRMDTSAAHTFAYVLRNSQASNYIATSEGKDEHGEVVEDPLKELTEYNSGGFGIAVDVVDGTTLAASGLNSSYTLSAGAFGLATFPDLQAYAVGAPEEVLKLFDFNNNPEEEILSLLNNLSKYYDKPIKELKIVTHSSDTGDHHSMLIEKIKSKGVQVIVPEPVIVEPPYTLGMALHTQNAPDCIIGVFGLPEIVINTLLLGIIGKDCQLQFRIASNTMLEKPKQKSLRDAFAFRYEEEEKLNLLNLRSDFVYTKESIASDLHNACFSATALTDDPVLGLRGYRREGSVVVLETLFSGYQGYAVKLKTYHNCNNSINYAGCFPQSIDDLSLVLPIPTPAVIGYIEDFISKLKSSCAGSSLDFTPISDLHVTLYEYGIHYGGYSYKKGLEVATKQAINTLQSIENEIICHLIEPKLTSNAIILKVKVSDELKDSLSNIRLSLDNEFFNVKRVPSELHITIARYNEYMSKKKLQELTKIVEEVSYIKEKSLYFKSSPDLVHITSTPYTVDSKWSR